MDRLVELAWSRRNERRLLDEGATLAARDGFGAIVLLHVLLFPAVLLEWTLAPWSGFWGASMALFALFLGAEALRLWASVTLGSRFTTRVLVPRGIPPLRRGPYRILRHPIYLAVFLEFILLPAAFGAFATALVGGFVYALLVRRRIRIEERVWAEMARPLTA
jgi:methyltransferase